jgi:uncharacterized protein (TIGR02421 family)
MKPSAAPFPDPDVLKIDRAIQKAGKHTDLLRHVTPINLEAERRRFFASRYRHVPEFRYRPVSLDPFAFKRTLHRVAVERIEDPRVQELYADVVQSYSDRADLLFSVGTERFVYSSLRYFGEPSGRDVSNAEFLLHCAPVEDPEDRHTLDPPVLERLFLETSQGYGFSCPLEYSTQIIAKALAGAKGLKIRKGVRFTQREAQALAHHEIGIHYLTTCNARLQKLRVFQSGLPVNTTTQEGMAILSEYLSGNLTLNRLREMALRVIAISSMLHGNNFPRTFQRLVDQYHVEPQHAFDVTVRAYRGGGFTKDYVYMSGFREMLQHFSAAKRMDSLLIGKTHLRYQETIEHMMESGMVTPPKYVPEAFRNPQKPHPILEYLTQSIR